MKKLVLEVKIDGVVGYLCDSPSMFSSNVITDDITKAKDYSKEPFELENDLDGIILPDDKSYAMSGFRVEECSLIEVEVIVQKIEQSRKPARKPNM